MSMTEDWRAPRGDDEERAEYDDWVDERDDEERLRRLEKDGVEA